MTGRIFDIQRFSVHDGPGIRTTVFMKGCPLSCKWCHNPEGLLEDFQVKYVKNECIGCARCGNRTLEEVKNCPSGALSICGRDIEAEELLVEVLKDKAFYSQGGGVTFSGGECLVQSDFVAHMLKLCKENGLNTTVDTSGYVDFKCIEKTLPYCDLYLYDIKSVDSKVHMEFTEVGNELILENLKKLTSKTDNVWIRVPIIPDVNDNEEEMHAIANLVKSLGKNFPVTLIPYHGLGKAKYETLGLVCPYDTDKKITKEKIKKFSDIFTSYNINLNGG